MKSMKCFLLVLLALVLQTQSFRKQQIRTLKTPPLHSSSVDFFIAGGLACCISHVVAVPFDVIKTRQQTQTDPVSLQKLIKDEGVGILLKGTGPTFIGYAIQGSMKYGFFELFKGIFPLDGVLHLMLSGAVAEIIGSSFLAPFEAVRIRLVSAPNFVDGGVLPCLKKIIATEGQGALFLGLPPILAKQIPFTVVQLSSFETLTGLIANSHLLDNQGRAAISTAAALVAAVFSSLASQPGDTLLSIVNKSSRIALATSSGGSASQPPSNSVAMMKDAAISLGLKGLFKGTKARLLHVGVIVVVQLLIYDSVKAALGIPIGGH